jgi:rhodanese-related sulfurtransferase
MESAAKRESVQEDIPEISREELKRHLHDGSLTIVDVLPAESYATAHIPGALSIPLEVVATRAPELLRDHAAEIVVYCGKLTCDRSEQALEQLQKLGYSNVRDYRAGIADWVESGEATESAASDPKTAAETLDAAATVDGPSLTVSSTGEAGRVPARVSQMRRLDNSVLGFVQQQSTLQLFLTWIVMILLCGAGYWLIGVAGDRSLVEAGAPIGTDLKRDLFQLRDRDFRRLRRRPSNRLRARDRSRGGCQRAAHLWRGGRQVRFASPGATGARNPPGHV